MITFDGKHLIESNPAHHFFLHSAVRVCLNTKNLSLNPFPFKVYSCLNMRGEEPKGKTDYGGWVVMMRVHPCDVLGEPSERIPRFVYKCRRLTTKTLVVEAPTLDFADIGHDDELIRTMLTSRADGEIIMDGLDNSRSDVEARMDSENNPMTGKMHYHLIFPDSCHLDESVLEKHKGMVNSELKMESIPLSRPVTRLAKTVKDQKGVEREEQTVCAAIRIFWHVADLNKEAQRKGRANCANEHDDDAFVDSFMNL